MGRTLGPRDNPAGKQKLGRFSWGPGRRLKTWGPGYGLPRDTTEQRGDPRGGAALLQPGPRRPAVSDVGRRPDQVRLGTAELARLAELAKGRRFTTTLMGPAATLPG